MVAEADLEEEEDLEKLADQIIRTMRDYHQLPLLFVVLCPVNAFPRTEDGCIQVERVRKSFDLGTLNPTFVRVNLREHGFRVPKTSADALRISTVNRRLSLVAPPPHQAPILQSEFDDLQVAVGSGSCELTVANSLPATPASPLSSSAIFNNNWIDHSSNFDLSTLNSIARVLIWRTNLNPEQVVYIQHDLYGREVKTLTLKKLNNRVASLVSLPCPTISCVILCVGARIGEA